MSKRVIIEAKDLKKTFQNGSENSLVLNKINLEIFANDFTVIMGPSGAGKSTLLYALSGMDRISDGQVLFQDKNISKIKERDLTKIRADDFGFVFQNSELISNLTIEENIKVAGIVKKEMSLHQLNEKTQELLKQMHIEKIKNHLSSEVSGGQAQRAAIARALIKDPKILFADEPTGSLNRKNTKEILDILTNSNQQGQTILMVTHDVESAVRGNRIIYLSDGKILDELNLTNYVQDQDDKRRKKLLNWLNGLAW